MLLQDLSPLPYKCQQKGLRRLNFYCHPGDRIVPRLLSTLWGRPTLYG